MVQPRKRRRDRLPSLAVLRPRSMLFTLFGDYIYPKGGDIWQGSLVTIGDATSVADIKKELAKAFQAYRDTYVERSRDHSLDKASV